MSDRLVYVWRDGKWQKLKEPRYPLERKYVIESQLGDWSRLYVLEELLRRRMFGSRTYYIKEI